MISKEIPLSKQEYFELVFPFISSLNLFIDISILALPILMNLNFFYDLVHLKSLEAKAYAEGDTIKAKKKARTRKDMFNFYIKDMVFKFLFGIVAIELRFDFFGFF